MADFKQPGTVTLQKLLNVAPTRPHYQHPVRLFKIVTTTHLLQETCALKNASICLDQKISNFAPVQFRRKEFKMLAKCANPSCSTPLVYLREGKIFMVESPSQPGRVGAAPLTAKTPSRVEHFW